MSSTISSILPAAAAAPRDIAAARQASGNLIDPGATPAPSPRLSLDHATGLVVIEFRGSNGRAGQSFPTEREMDAYRRNLGGGEPRVTPAPGRDAPPAERASAA